MPSALAACDSSAVRQTVTVVGVTEHRQTWQAVAALAAVATVIVAIVALAKNDQPTSNNTEQRPATSTTKQSPPESTPEREPTTVVPVATTTSQPPGAPPALQRGGPLNIRVWLKSGASGINVVARNDRAEIGLEVSDQGGFYKRGDEECFMHIEWYTNGNFEDNFDYECRNFVFSSVYSEGIWRLDYTITTIHGQTGTASFTFNVVKN